MISERELRDSLGDVLRRAQTGERIVVTVDGRPVAQVGPVSASRPSATMRTLRELPPADGGRLADQQRLRDEGRPESA